MSTREIHLNTVITLRPLTPKEADNLHLHPNAGYEPAKEMERVEPIEVAAAIEALLIDPETQQYIQSENELYAGFQSVDVSVSKRKLNGGSNE